jgi:hypothetical protein
MKLKSSDKVSKLYNLYASGVINADHVNGIIENKVASMGSHLDWSLKTFERLIAVESDAEIIRIIKGDGSFDVLNMPLGEYAELLNLVKRGMSDINEAISMIEHPPMSGKLIDAGYSSLNFGTMGIARSVAEFERMNTLQAYELPMLFVIKSLSQSAQVQMCKYRHDQLMELESKSKHI